MKLKVKKPSNIVRKAKPAEVTYSSDQLYRSTGIYRTKNDHVLHATPSFVIVLNATTAVFYDGIDTIDAFLPDEWTKDDRFIKINANVVFGIEEI